ncbi:helix-turn-helix domain-containing protein, partial [Halomonas litopenaei]|nr:helix-turn-helix domain-containing protein [Halomonas litopenaei]
GKSLLDVQRELKIKAAYIAAIENADPSAFDTPGFIAGYVRSYARYLGMDPEEAFAGFCAESGFATAHGMSAEASSLKGKTYDPAGVPLGKDIFSASATPFIPAGDAMLAGIEPRAIGSVLVLVALIGGLGFGGWTVLQEVQKVQFAPVEQTPVVVSDLDPLAGATNAIEPSDALAGFEAPSA